MSKLKKKTTLTKNIKEDEFISQTQENIEEEEEEEELSENENKKMKIISKENNIKEYHECGIIEKIQLINFMCHANAEMSFNKTVNIITG
jgi:hypothetical protein